MASAYHDHNTSDASNESSNESIIEDGIETEVIKSPHDIMSYVSIKVETGMPALANLLSQCLNGDNDILSNVTVKRDPPWHVNVPAQLDSLARFDPRQIGPGLI